METAVAKERGSAKERAVAVVAILAGLCGLASVVFVKLAIAAMTVGLLAFLALPKEGGALARVGRTLLLVAAPFILVGLVRFTILEAAPGIVEGGRRALTGRAVAKLRVLCNAQDVAREQAFWDPDGDGIGSALSLDEMLLRAPLRGKGKMKAALLQNFPNVIEHEGLTLGVADGYVFALFLPRAGGGATTTGDDVDDEAAERRWLAYAWPMDRGHGERPVVFIDEHERILVADASDDPEHVPHYLGTERIPAFSAALTGPTLDAVAAMDAVGQDGLRWVPWKGKTAREKLPGDR
jgi:hypothetical protein